MISNGNPVYRFEELNSTSKKTAIEECEYELLVDVINNIEMKDYFDPIKKNLEKKGFMSINFYRFFIENDDIRIDFTFDYLIVKDNFNTFKKFAETINLKTPYNFSNYISNGLLDVIIRSEKYDDIDEKQHNIIIDTEIVDHNLIIEQFIAELKTVFENYYTYLLKKMYTKIKKDIKDLTGANEVKAFIQEQEFYSNGMIH